MARGDFPSTRQDQYMVRFPDGLRDRVKAKADDNGRSMNAELIARVERSFEDEERAQQQIDVVDAMLQTMSVMKTSMEAIKTTLTDLRREVHELKEGPTRPRPTLSHEEILKEFQRIADEALNGRIKADEK